MDSIDIMAVDDGGRAVPVNVIAGRPVAIAYADDNGGLLSVEYPEGDLETGLAAAILGNLIKDVLGEPPDLRKVVELQKTLMAVMSGGESDAAGRRNSRQNAKG